MNDDSAAHVRHPAGIMRWAVRITLVIIALVFALWLVLFITKGRFLRPWFEQIASARVHRPVRVPGEFNLYFDPFDVAFRADGITVGDAPWASQPIFFRARHLALRIHTWPLIWGKTRIAVADLEGANAALQWDAHHLRNNWTFGEPSAPPRPFEMPDIERGLIIDTHLTYSDPLAQMALKVAIHPLTAMASHIAQSVGFTGSGTVRRYPVQFAGHVDSPEQVLRAGASKVVLHAHGADTTIDLAGEMPGITQIAAGHYNLAVRGTNMANLFDLIGATAIATRHYHLVTQMTYDQDAWVFTGIKGTFGDSDLAGRLAVAMPHERLHMDADLRTVSLDLLDAAPFLGYDPKRLDAMGTKGLIMRDHGHPRILPDAPLQSEAVRRFDADVHYRVGAIAAKGFPLSAIDLTLQLDHGLMTLKPISAVVATGRLDGDVVLDARPAVAITDYRLRLHPTPMGKLLVRFGVQEAGTNGTLSARVAMRGVGNSVRESLAHANGRMVAIIPSGTMWARNIQLAELDIGTFVQRLVQRKLKDPVQINCGLIGFTVRDGVSRADPILIDTQKNVITGQGMFSFRDEAVDFEMRAKAKKFSLFSLQSPIGVGGYLAQPHLKLVSRQLVTRAGAAVALGVVASPLAALLAFIDPGNGKAAACGPVLAGATAAAQRTVTGQPRKDLHTRKP